MVDVRNHPCQASLIWTCTKQNRSQAGQRERRQRPCLLLGSKAMKMGCGARGARSFLPTRVLQSASLNRSTTCCVLRSLSNGTRLGNLPARLSTATARFGTFPHSFDIVVFSALVC